MQNDELIRVYVGTDRSQALACKVLTYSIQRHTTARVEVVPMLDLAIPLPQDPSNYPRTGFSLARFCIPSLAGYRGRAIYVDADMLVFKDIRGLWNLPFDGASLLIQKDQVLKRALGRTRTKRQCSVMLLNCEQLKWDVRDLVRRLDAHEFSYADMIEQLCIVPENEIAMRLPDTWNHLDQYNDDTCLMHFTNMHTQPWMSSLHPLAEIWFSEVRLMLSDGSLTWAEIQNDINEGYLRPSLIRDLKIGHRLPWGVRHVFNWFSHASDYLSGYRPHSTFLRLIKESREQSIQHRSN